MELHICSGNALTDFFLKDVGITQNQFNLGQQMLSLGIVLLEVGISLYLVKISLIWIRFLLIMFYIVLGRPSGSVHRLSHGMVPPSIKWLDTVIHQKKKRKERRKEKEKADREKNINIQELSGDFPGVPERIWIIYCHTVNSRVWTHYFPVFPASVSPFWLGCWWRAVFAKVVSSQRASLQSLGGIRSTKPVNGILGSS